MVKRNSGKLTDREFDVVIVGGGIFGACAAWDAALRGLTVALIEKGDFAGGTSANSFKMVHGGIRYMQHADLTRVRASCAERSALLRIAPHLVTPLPIAIPTYGFGMQGKPILGVGSWAYDLLTADRNRGIADRDRHIPWTRLIDRRELLERFPGLPADRLTGAALIHDGQIYNPTRLVWAFVRSAVEVGTVAVNYVAATKLMVEDGRVNGVCVRDTLSGEVMTVRCRALLNAAGPWAEQFLGKGAGITLTRPHTYSRDVCFVVPRRIHSDWALALPSRTRDSDALVSRSTRHLFMAPWRDYTLIGVWHLIHEGDPAGFTVHIDELEAYIDEINWIYPELELALDDITLWNAGLLPFGEKQQHDQNLSFGKRSILVDHAREHGIDGLVTLIGIRYTMGRGDAARAVSMICRQLGHESPPPPTDRLPVYGGDLDNFERCVDDVAAALADIDRGVARSVAHNHGSAYTRLLAYGHEDPQLLEPLPGSRTLGAEILHAVDEELAQTLGDVVFRRTDLATGGHPGDAALARAVQLIGDRLHWDPSRRCAERAQVEARFPSWMAEDVTTGHALAG